MAKLKMCLAFIVFMSLGLTISAQEEIKKEKNLKNTIRYNLSNPMIFGGNSLIFGYERVVGPHQTFSINLGQSTLPESHFLNNGNNFTVSRSSRGYHASADYRFYLKKENKYNAPHGVYIGPYYSFNFFERKNTWSLNSSTFQGEVESDFKLNIQAVGCELGYQFILWKRLALDFVLLGPGVARYSAKASLNTTLSAEDQSEVLQKINDALSSRLPGYSLAIDGNEFKKTGKVESFAGSFRYIIHLGFRF